MRKPSTLLSWSQFLCCCLLVCSLGLSQSVSAQCNVGTSTGTITAPTTCSGSTTSMGAGEFKTMTFAAGVVYQFSYTDNAQSSGMCINGTRYTGTTNFTPGAVTWNVGIYRNTGTWTTSSAVLSYKLVTPGLTTGGGGTSCNSVAVTAAATNGTAYWQNTTNCGTSTATASTSQTVSSSGTYYYNANNGGCWSGCSSQTVTINASSSAPTSISGNTTICNGGNTTLSVSGGSVGTGSSVKWYAGGCGSGTAVGTGASILVAPTSTTTYYARYEDPAPCSSNTACLSTTVTVNTASTAPTSITGGGATICQGSGVTLTAAGGSLGTGATYQWGTGSTVGTSPIGGATSASYTPTPSSTTSYWVSVTGAAPCGSPSGGATTTITVNTPSTAPTGISGTTLVCNGTGTTLTATGGSLGTGATYQWGTGGTVGTSPISGATSASYSVTPSSTTTYWVSVTGAAPCGSPSGGATATVTVNTPSSAVTSISGSTLICQGSSTTLTALGGSLGTGATYQWGTGSTVGTSPIGGATSVSYTPTPSSTTSYWVSVTGPAPCGGAGGVSTTVTVNNPSTAPTAITGGGTTICQGSSVTLTATGGTLGTSAQYVWGTGSVGTGVFQLSTSTTATVTPSATTTYWVSVTGTASPCSNPGGSATTSVTVNNPSTAPVAITGGGTICQGSTATLTAIGGTLGTGANYVWGTGSVGTGVFQTSTSTTATVTPSSTTSYWVSVTGTTAPCSNPGGSATATVSVAVPSTAVTGISGTTSLCSGTGTTLTATGGSLGTGANYQWGTGNVVGTSAIPGATSVTYSVTPVSTTSYWVSITGPSPCNGAGGVSTTVTVTTTPTPTFSTVPASPICTYTNATYTTQSGYTNYVWSNFGTAGLDYNIISGGLGSTDNTVTLQWLTTGTKTVGISYSNGSCPAPTPGATTTVVNASPTPTLSTSGAFCTSNSIVYTTQSGQSSYTWTFSGTAGVDYTLVAGGGSTNSTATVQWLTTGSKTVTVNYTNGSGCTGPTAASTSNSVSNGPTGASISDVIDPCNGGHTATVTITGGTSPYNFTVCGTAFTNQLSPFELDATSNTSCSLSLVSDANGCTPSTISGSPVSYPTRTLTSGDTYACTISTGAQKVFYDNSGNLMVKITDGGGTLGSTNVVVTRDASVQQFGPTNPQSYLQRHFKISPTNTAGSASVCLYMTDAEVSALNTSSSANDNHSAPSYYPTFQTNLSNAVVTKFHGAGETPTSNTSRLVLTPTSKTHNPTVNGVTYNNVWEVCMNVTSWSGFYIHGQNTNNTPLPVTLLYLTADAIENKYIDLDWATASEINNSGFAIERSTNGSDFTQIAWVDGHGNSNTQLSYSYSDRTVQPGMVYYYRLKQVDFDGQSTRSEIVSASLLGDKGFSFEDMVPNPAVNSVQLGILTTSGQKASVTITDMLGRVVLNQPWQLAEGYNVSTFDISDLAQGTYSVTVYAGNAFTTKKLVVTK